MNNVVLIGRLTKDPEVRYTPGNQTAVATFTLAIDRPVKNGEEKKTDYPRVITFGKQAENCGKYITKGRLIGIQGRIQTGSYKNKDGATVYTTDIVADRVEFLEKANKAGNTNNAANMENPGGYDEVPEGFEQLMDDEVPF